MGTSAEYDGAAVWWTMGEKSPFSQPPPTIITAQRGSGLIDQDRDELQAAYAYEERPRDLWEIFGL